MSEKAEVKRRKKEIAGLLGKALEGQAAYILLTIDASGQITISTDLKKKMAVLVMKRAIVMTQEEIDQKAEEARKRIILASR
jgi:hypothetical protein